MSAEREREIIQALEEILSLYGIKIDEKKWEREEEKETDYSEVITKAQKRIDELNEHAEEIFKKIGMNRQQLEAYASNPDNFTNEQWEALQKVKKACETYQQEVRENLKETVGENEINEAVEKRKKEKPLFTKRKHWLSM